MVKVNKKKKVKVIVKKIDKKESIVPIIKVLPIDLEHERLLPALFFFWDGFERATMNFFLVKDTARQVISGSPLSGDRITIGIRRMEWNGGQQGVFKAFMDHEKMIPEEISKDLLKYTYHGVPVYLGIYEENPTLSGLDIVVYAYDTFNIPNPFSLFCEKYDTI